MNPTRTRGIAVVAVLALVFTAGCGPGNSASGPNGAVGPEGQSGGRLFGVSFQTMNNPFFVDLSDGLREIIEAHGDRLVVLDAQFNSLKQRNDVSDLILQGAAGVFLNPVNWEGLKGSLLQAQRRKVPMIVVDAPTKDRDMILCTVASDNVLAGRLAARALAEARPNARLVVLHHSINKACIDRVAGFHEEIAKYPDIKILDTQEGKGTTEGARPVMRDLIGRHPDLDAVFAINDPSALGAISALESAGKLKQVTVVAVDGSDAGVAAIRAGKLYATSAQFPREIGRIAAQKMIAHLDGQRVQADIKVRVQLITAANADEFCQPN